jgi:flavin reductase (DIM6/NTAB) family NADH-FMN oxidoreductase RutF
MDAAIDVGTFWRLLGMRAIGAAVVTARSSAGPAGFLALSATHVTASPPTMLVSIGSKTSALVAVTESGAFAINYLPREREDLAIDFGGRGALKGADRFKPDEWATLSTGSPILQGAVGAIDCRVEEIIMRHDTAIVLGRIVAWVQGGQVSPLISFGGRYS